MAAALLDDLGESDDLWARANNNQELQATVVCEPYFI